MMATYRAHFAYLQVSAASADGQHSEEPSEIVIEVEDINDNSPVFQPKTQHAVVQENSPEGAHANQSIKVRSHIFNSNLGS